MRLTMVRKLAVREFLLCTVCGARIHKAGR
jgi:hypothetical protein